MNLIEALERHVDDNVALVPARRQYFAIDFKDSMNFLSLVNACKRAVGAAMNEKHLASRVAEIARYLGRLEGK